MTTNSRPARREDGFPTRSDIRFDTDAERLCRITLQLVESMGASEALTHAVVALDQARNHIADHVEHRAVSGDTTQPDEQRRNEHGHIIGNDECESSASEGCSCPQPDEQRCEACDGENHGACTAPIEVGDGYGLCCDDQYTIRVPVAPEPPNEQPPDMYDWFKGCRCLPLLAGTPRTVHWRGCPLSEQVARCVVCSLTLSVQMTLTAASVASIGTTNSHRAMRAASKQQRMRCAVAASRSAALAVTTTACISLAPFWRLSPTPPRSRRSSDERRGDRMRDLLACGEPVTRATGGPSERDHRNDPPLREASSAARRVLGAMRTRRNGAAPTRRRLSRRLGLPRPVSGSVVWGGAGVSALESNSQRGDHPHTDPGDGRTECETCGKWVWPVTHSCKGVAVTAAALKRVDRQEERWALELTCCGRENGFQVAASWAEADEFREGYSGREALHALGFQTLDPHGYSGDGRGHQRSARIYRTLGAVHPGYHDEKPPEVSGDTTQPDRQDARQAGDFCGTRAGSVVWGGAEMSDYATKCICGAYREDACICGTWAFARTENEAGRTDTPISGVHTAAPDVTEGLEAAIEAFLDHHSHDRCVDCLTRIYQAGVLDAAAAAESELTRVRVDPDDPETIEAAARALHRTFLGGQPAADAELHWSLFCENYRERARAVLAAVTQEVKPE